MSRREKFKTFITEQKMILFFQIAILLGLLVQVIMFVAYIWYGRPAPTDTAMIIQFFTVAAFWVLTIDGGVFLFWWVSRLGPWVLQDDEEEESTVF